MSTSPASPASTLAPCGCQTATAGEETFSERIAKDLRSTTVSEWIQVALGAGALYLSWRIYQEIKK